jgi:tRNA (guanosine-2'-O-)-methyltransferase
MNRVNWKLATFEEKQNFYSELRKDLSLSKRQLFDDKVKKRTRHFSLALEDMIKSQNASALMRTADAFGIQRVDIYDKNERFNIRSSIGKSAEKWLESNFFNTYDDGGISPMGIFT